MKPTKLVLRNWCQHSDLEIVFVDGMNNISGRNGQGKSNIIDALHACLGQNSNNAVNRLTDNIQYGKESGYVVMTFTHDNKEGELRVDLSRNYTEDSTAYYAAIEAAKLAVTNSATGTEAVESVYKLSTAKPTEKIKYTMKWDGVTYTKKTEIAEIIKQLTWVSPEYISTNFFPRQGDVQSIIGSSAVERQRVFHEKAGTAMCERAYQVIGEELSSLGSGSSDLKNLLDQEILNAAKLEAELKDVQHRKDSLQTCSVDYQACLLVFRQFEEQKQAAVRNAELTSTVMQLKLELTEVTATLAGVSSRLTDAQQRKITLDTLSAAASTALSQDEAAQRVHNTLKSAEQSVTVASKALEALSVKQLPPKPPEPMPFETMRQRLQELVFKAKELKGQVAQAGSGICPTCGQSIVGHEHHLAQLKEQLNTVVEEGKQLKPLHDALEAWFKGESALKAEWETAERDLERSKSHYAQVVSTSGPLTLLTPEQRQTYLDDVKRAKECNAMLAELTSLHSQGSQRRHALELKISETQTSLARVNSGTEVTQEMFDRASRDVAEYQSWSSLDRELSTSLSVAKDRLERSQAAVKNLEKSIQEAALLGAWREVLTEARGILHRDNVPTTVVQWYAEQLAIQTMSYLELFDASFSLQVAEDQSLLAQYTDKVLPAYRLSGGEKNMLSLSMRLAMFDLFPTALHLITLDEVEVHLDERNVARLPVVLEKVKGLARSRDLVVLFISHHPSLSDISDHCITLK